MSFTLKELFCFAARGVAEDLPFLRTRHGGVMVSHFCSKPTLSWLTPSFAAAAAAATPELALRLGLLFSFSVPC